MKCFIFGRNTPLSDGNPGFLFLRNILRKREEAKNRWGGQRFRQRNERREEWMMRGGRADVWGPPCLPTMSSSTPFPHLSVSLSLFWLYSDFSSSLLCFFLFLLLFLTPPSLPLCMFLSLLFRSHTPFLTSLCFYSCLFAALHLFFRSPLFSFLNSYFILFMYSTHCIFTPNVCSMLKLESWRFQSEMICQHSWLLVHFNYPGPEILLEMTRVKHTLSSYSFQKSLISLTFTYSPSLHGLLSSVVSVGNIIQRFAPSPDL